jgi:Holliday junction resolvasome RuvABC DNA-binding subunit
LNSPDFNSLYPLVLEAELSYPLDDLLDSLTGYAPPKFPPPIAGGAIWDDIWHAVETLWSFVSYPNMLMGWLWDHVIMKLWGRVGDVWDWFWHNILWPNLWWVWSTLKGSLDWLWQNAIQPAFQYLWALTSGTFNWLWNNAIQPAFQYLWALVSGTFNWLWSNAIQPAFNWLWSNAIQPAFQYLWALTSGTFNWLWSNAIQPAFQYLWALVSGTFTWLWENAIHPAFTWIWDHILTKFDDLAGWLKDKFSDFGKEVKNEFTNLAETTTNLVMAGGQAIGEGFQNALQWLFEHVFDPIADSIKVKLSIPRKLLTGQYHDIEDLLADIEDPFSASSIPALLWAIPCATLALIPAMMEMGSLHFRRNIYNVARDVGATIPTFADLRDALLRGRMSEVEHDWWLGSAGFSKENIDIIKELYFDIPTPSDLVRMAVREVFTPEIVARYGQMEDFPPEFAKWAKQTGISDFWAHAHWAAHWGLPSVTEGFDMFHRDILSEDELKVLLRVLDVMPYWRDRLIKIAYRVISRIDIRRMYNTGVVGRDKVLRVYKDMGYRPEDAEFLTEYVVRAAAGISKDLPRETIVTAYRERLLTHDDAVDQLLELGFDEEQAEMFLSQADLQVENQNARLAEDIFEADFKSGAATEAQTRASLTYIGVPEARINLLIGLWSRQAAKRTAGLSPSQLQRLYHEGLMNEATLRERLTVLGYNEADIAYLVQLSSPEAPAEPRLLTLAHTQAALREGLIETSEFTGRLEAMGYPPEDISILVDLTQPEEIVGVKVLSVSQLQRAFRQGIIAEGELRAGLSDRGYTPDVVDVLVALSQPAVAVRARELTVSQLQRAFRQGLLSESQLHGRLLELGYSAEAADVLVELARPAEEAQPRELTVSQLQRALREGLLPEAEVQAQLTSLGYSAGAVSTIIALAHPEELVKERDLSVAQGQRAFREGLISEEELRRRLADLGFSSLDVDILVELARPEVT